MRNEMPAWEKYYRQYYANEAMFNREQLIDEIIRQKEMVNIRAAIEVDSKWISKYSQIADKCYMLNSDLIQENKWLKEEIVIMQDQIKEKYETKQKAIQQNKELLGL